MTNGITMEDRQLLLHLDHPNPRVVLNEDHIPMILDALNRAIAAYDAMYQNSLSQSQTNEAMGKKLKEFSEKYDALVSADGCWKYRAEKVEEMLDALAAQNEWRPIKTGPIDDICIVFDRHSNVEHTAKQAKSVDENGSDIGYRWFTGYTWGTAQCITDPTHWKPLSQLPQPPKENHNAK